MNYIEVPNSNIKLVDGSVVMLARFPGTKWVVHYGWYEYSGCRSMGWYFSSIPAQTVIPVTSSDLQLIVLVEPGSTVDPDLPPFPPGPYPPPYPPGPIPPGPIPPGPIPPAPAPPAVFTQSDKYFLDSAWITLPSIQYRDMLPFIGRVPDGKVVKIDNEDGISKYYAWNAKYQRWDEKFYEAEGVPVYLGESTTVITDGGSQSPTINGQSISTSDLKTGDWVIYNGVQYIWSEDHWSSYGGTSAPIVVSSTNISIPATAWKDSSDTSYPKMAQIRMQEVNAEYFAVVQFDDMDSMKYDFAYYTTVTTDSSDPGYGIVTIYCKDPYPEIEITIPSITCFKTITVSTTAVT